DFLDYDICDIENYCITWNVEGNMWDNEFTAPADDISNLNRINETRKQIMQPLSEFKNSCTNASAKDICLALYKLLDEIKLSQQMFSKIKIASSDSEKDFELAREFKQLWKTVLSAVSAIYNRFDDEKISLREFSDIFNLMISGMTVSKPPQTVDCIRIASTNHSRLSDVKIAFVMEANSGVFPADISNNGLLTNNDKKKLEELKLNVSSSAMRQIEGEKLNVYLALTMPEDKLYVTYSESDFQGSSKRPSIIISMLKRMFGNIETKAQDIPIDFFCTSYRTAFYKYLEKSSDRNSLIASIRESLKYSDFYESKLNYVSSASKKQEHKLSDEMAKKLFFSQDMNLSATRVKDYYSCPFSYYCKYGLKLKAPSPVEINPINTGNLIHSCFEKIMSIKDQNDKKTYNNDFPKLTDKVIKARIHEEFINYTNEFLGGNFGKTPSFIAAMNRLENSAFFAVKNIQTEFADSLFIPQAFEYNLTKDNGESILQLKLDDDIKINIRGSIDRADVYKAENGDQYIRIVDYKTGDTTLRLEELYNGLNLQMLIYLLAVTQRINDLNQKGNLKPSAILYSHINFVKAGFTPDEIESLKNGEDLDYELVRKRASTYKPDGMMIENEFTLKAMNKRFSGAFTPFKFTSKGEISGNGKKPVSEEYFLGLEQFALMKLYEMADKLKCGEIFADPIETSKFLTCTYCDYWSICGNSSPKNPRKAEKSDIDKLNEEIDNIIALKK
ncbi:MAG: PD-(D/E)XK nuclease family protein, partial [Ruminococcus sp.]|nr:PD-(D/E)XK nuclease family protein [Ruminococcus sp.]